MENIKDTQTRSPSAGLALLAGLTAGFAAGMFLKSSSGQRMTEDTKKKAKILQKQISAKIRNVKSVTKDAYEEIVNEFVDDFAETSQLAKSQIKDLKQTLMDQWESVKDQLTNNGDYYDDEEEDEEANGGRKNRK